MASPRSTSFLPTSRKSPYPAALVLATETQEWEMQALVLTTEAQEWETQARPVAFHCRVRISCEVARFLLGLSWPPLARDDGDDDDLKGIRWRLRSLGQPRPLGRHQRWRRCWT